jgi:hypothetical protein
MAAITYKNCPQCGKPNRSDLDECGWCLNELDEPMPFMWGLAAVAVVAMLVTLVKVFA